MMNLNVKGLALIFLGSLLGSGPVMAMEPGKMALNNISDTLYRDSLNETIEEVSQIIQEYNKHKPKESDHIIFNLGDRESINNIYYIVIGAPGSNMKCYLKMLPKNPKTIDLAIWAPEQGDGPQLALCKKTPQNCVKYVTTILSHKDYFPESWEAMRDFNPDNIEKGGIIPQNLVNHVVQILKS